MPKRNDITDKIVINLYFNKKFSCNKVSKILKCDRSTIKERIKKNGLKLRNCSMSEHVYNGMKRSVKISKEFYSILDGELLGDGSISVRRENCMGFFSEEVGFNRKEWLEFISKLFINSGIPITGNKIYNREKRNTWYFSTKGTEEIGQLFRKWYVKNNNFDPEKPKCFSNRKNIKMIPTDLKLTKQTLIHWYIGDGKHSRKSSIFLCTNGFSRGEVELLRFILKRDFDLITYYSKENIIGIPRFEASRFVELMGPCPVKCYEYKWDINYKFKTKVNDYIDMKMVDQYIKYREEL